MVTVNKKRLSKLLVDITSEEMPVRLAALNELSIIVRKRGRKADRVLKRINDDYGNRFSREAVVKVIRYHSGKIVREGNPDKEQRSVLAGIFRRIDPRRIEAEKASKRAVFFGLVDIAAVIVLASLLVVGFVESVSNCKAYRYYSASLLMDAGEYETAAEAYEALGDYKESKSRYEAIHEKLGSKYLGQKDYEKAVAEYAKAGAEAADKYNYALGFMCVDNEDYIDAYNILGGVRDFDIDNTLKRVTLLAAKEYLEQGNIAMCRQLLSELPDGYGTEEFTAKELRNLLVVNRKWIESVGRKSDISGTIGAYEYIEGRCEGWDYDLEKIPVHGSVELEMTISDDMSFGLTVTVDYPVCAVYSRDSMLQSMFITGNTVTKTFNSGNLSDVISLDDNTQLVVADGECQITYRKEEMQILPDDPEGNRVLTVKESKVVYR